MGQHEGLSAELGPGLLPFPAPLITNGGGLVTLDPTPSGGLVGSNTHSGPIGISGKVGSNLPWGLHGGRLDFEPDPKTVAKIKDSFCLVL